MSTKLPVIRLVFSFNGCIYRVVETGRNLIYELSDGRDSMGEQTWIPVRDDDAHSHRALSSILLAILLGDDHPISASLDKSFQILGRNLPRRCKHGDGDAIW